MRANEPQKLISDLLFKLRTSKTYPHGLAKQVCARVAESNDEDSRRYSAEFFSRLVEPLSDSFLPEDVTLYNLVFAQLIQSCRAGRRGTSIDSELRSFGLNSEQDLFSRAERINRQVKKLSASPSVRRAIVLSRVTVGADVAITSVIIDRLEQFFPESEIVLIGSTKLRELFGGDSRARFVESGYKRSGSAIERLLASLEVQSQVRGLSEELSPGECIVVDPDSRLTQLGLLPVIDDDLYFFFPSRRYKSDSSSTLAKLTSDWLNELSSQSIETAPVLRPTEADVQLGRKASALLRGHNRSPVVTVNFGVGENPSKRIGADFEAELLGRLIAEDMRVILDKGAGVEESALADAVIQLVQRHQQNRKVNVLETDEAGLMQIGEHSGTDAELLTWSGRIGILTALINASDLYIGYDSAGQHIAAALGVPCVDVFAGAASERFRQRWSPAGGSKSAVVDATGKGSRTVLDEAMTRARRLLTEFASS
jgi:ADP-heptose:LPS heptosyltransferase